MQFIPLASPNILDTDIQEVVDVLKTGMLVQGKKVLELETNVGNFVHAKHVAAVSNGTATMHLALVALGIGPGDEVIVPAFSYIATANVVELVGATPIFVDINIRTFNIDVSQIESKINTKTKAIIPVHEFGLACEIEAIMQLAVKHKLFVIEDAACALGAKYKNINVGTFGHFGSFSLHPRKAISSGEGGLLVCHSLDYLNKIQILRNHGIELKNGKMDFVAVGFNYRMTDFQAALVNSQLNRLNDTLIYKNDLANTYFEHLDGAKMNLPEIPDHCTHTWQTFHVLLDPKIDRDGLIDQLKNKGIGTNYGAQCIPDQTFYYQKYGFDCQRQFPNAYNSYTNGIAIPLYEKLSKEDISYIAKELNKLV